jgi:hypothetical protein
MTIEDPALPMPTSQFQNLQTIRHQNPTQRQANEDNHRDQSEKVQKKQT